MAGVASGYLPIRSELDPRPAMAALAALGWRLALPVVTAAEQPLVFRAWTPDAAMVAAGFGLKVPVDGPEVVPALLLVPMLAFDRRGHRLGYGGGFYDRTLAGLHGRGRAAAGHRPRLRGAGGRAASRRRDRHPTRCDRHRGGGDPAGVTLTRPAGRPTTRVRRLPRRPCAGRRRSRRGADGRSTAPDAPARAGAEHGDGGLGPAELEAVRREQDHRERHQPPCRP